MKASEYTLLHWTREPSVVPGRQESTAVPEQGLLPPLRGLGLLPSLQLCLLLLQMGRKTERGCRGDWQLQLFFERKSRVSRRWPLLDAWCSETGVFFFFFFRDKRWNRISQGFHFHKSFHSMDCSGRMILESETHSIHTPECLSVRADPASLWQRMV